MNFKLYYFKIILWVFVFSFSSAALAQTYIPGSVYYGRNEYIAYYAGDLPLIFSAGHGGALTPSEIPDRTYGTTVTDSKTIETVMAIRNAVYNLTGRYPHVVYSNLKRTKLDPNREIVEGAQGNQWAEQAWNEYHGFIEIAKDSITANYEKGFYVDMHGHGHEIKRLELGYLLSSANLELTDNQLNTATYINKSSIHDLVEDSPFSFPEILRGAKSIGTMFEERGIPAVPSLNQPFPGLENPYFSGGYSTQRHGSSDSGVVSALQIEAHLAGIRDNSTNRENFAQKLTEILNIYVQDHFGWDGIVSGIVEAGQMPENFFLGQNYPNPFNPKTVISYQLSVNSEVNLSVFNLLGQKVSTLVNEKQQAGFHSIEWVANDFAAGVYFYRLTGNGFSQTRKMVYLP